MQLQFDHEKLHVYQESLNFIAWLQPILDKRPKRLSVCDQLDGASTSIPLNIAEGNGRFTALDRCRFFDTARGSALECAAGLDVLVAKELLTQEEAEAGKRALVAVVSMLVGLIKNNSPNRVHEEGLAYGAGE